MSVSQFIKLVFCAVILFIPLSVVAQFAPPPALPGQESVNPLSDERIRKRLAVMPVSVGRLASELRMDPATVARLAQDKIEESLDTTGKFVLTNRSALADITREQQLAQSNLFNSELAPTTGALIPAQFLLYATVQDVYLGEQQSTQRSSQADALIRRAEALESQARSRRAALESQARSVQRSVSTPRQAVGSQTDCNSLHRCGTMTGNQRTWCLSQRQSCENSKAMMAAASRSARVQEEANAMSSLDGSYAAIQQLEEQARALRDQAKWSASEASSQSTRSVEVSIIWRVLDTSTGAVIESGSNFGSQISRNEASSVSAGSTYQGRSTETAYNRAVQSALNSAILGLARDSGRAMSKEPFIAKVVRFNSDGTALINAGETFGLRVGDTFGVRDTSSIVTDPDTGEILKAPGRPVGIIRVVSVQGKVSTGEIIRGVEALRRGDELIYLGHNP